MGEPFSFGLKLKMTPKVSNIVYLENKKDEHNKFYYISLYPEATSWVVQTHYGRLGTNGTTGRNKFSTEQEAHKFFRDKIDQKTADRKGYQRLNRPSNSVVNVKNYKS